MHEKIAKKRKNAATAIEVTQLTKKVTKVKLDNLILIFSNCQIFFI